MKKKIAKLFVLSLLSLATTVSCNGTNTSNTNTSVSTPISDSTSSVAPVSDVKITYSNIKTSYEVGETFTVRFTVTTSASDKKLKFSLEDQSENSPSVTGSDKKSLSFNDGVSVSLYGKKKGTCTLVATACADESVSVRIPLTIVAPVATLQNVWKKVNQLSNYTLDITRTPTTDELNEHDSWSDDTKVPVKKIKITENALIEEVADELADDVSNTTYKPCYTNSNGTSLLGLGVDKDGYVFTLLKDSAGNYVADSRDTTGKDGFRLKEDLSGNGDETSSPNDLFITNNGDANDPHYYTFGGLRAINSSWFSSFEKSYDNTYEIAFEDGESEDSTAASYFAFIKAVLFELVDADSFMAEAQTSTDYTDIVSNIDVTVTCLSNNSVSIDMTYGTTEYNISMTDVKSTTVDSALTTYLGTASTTAPDIYYSDLTALSDAFATNDYYTEGSSTYGSYGTYFYGNYFFNYYSPEMIAYYESKGRTLSSGGYALINTHLYEISFTDEVKDSSGNVTTAASVTIDTTPYSYNGTALTINSTAEFASVIGSYGGSDTFGDSSKGYLHSFKQYSNGSTTIYYSTSQAVSDDLFGIWSGGYTIKQALQGEAGITFDGYDTEFQISKTTTQDASGNNVSKISSVMIVYGSFTLNGQSGYAYTDTVKFGSETGNKYHSVIEDAISNFSTGA